MTKTSSARNRARHPAAVEAMEPRQLFSSATLSGGVLRVAGDLRSTNQILVYDNPDGLSVDVLVRSVDRRGDAHSRTWSFAKSEGALRQVHVRGGIRNDIVQVATNLPARVLALGGDDVVNTAGGNDVIFGGAGNDSLNGWDGDDRVRGEHGDDMLLGGGGHDRINAGPGNDSAHGGAGDDVVRGEVGNDMLTGSEGNDALFGGWGGDVLTGDDGDDSLWGGVGDDTLTGGAGNDLLGGIYGANAIFGGEGADTFYVLDLNLNPFNDFTAADDTVNQRTRKEVLPPPV